MDKKIMMTILLNQCQIMDSISKLVTIIVSENTRNPRAGQYLDCAEALLKRSTQTKDIMKNYL